MRQLHLRGSSSLLFSTLREANVRRLPTFKNANGQPAHSTEDGSDWTTAEWFMAVVGEVGELGNLLKKIRRGDLDDSDSNTFTKFMIADELADIVTYLDILAFRLQIDLGEAVREKFNVVSQRVDSPITLERLVLGDSTSYTYVNEREQIKKEDGVDDLPF